MNPTLEIQKITLKLRNVDVIDDRIALIKEAIRIADASNNIQKGFVLRKSLISEENETSRCIESFPAFTWILEAHKKHPDIVEPKNFLWQYKWMVNAALRNASISMDQINYITESYKDALSENGYTLRVYHTLKSHIASFIGDKKTEKKYIDVRNKELRDDMSNCEACELDDEVDYYMSVGEIKKALLIGDKLLTGKISCTRTPFITYTGSLMYLYNAGEKEKATEFFEKAEKYVAELENDTSRSSDIAKMIEYLCAINDRDKAWSYFEKYAWWNIDSEDYVNYSFSVHVLPLLKEGGVRKMNLSTKLPYYNSTDEYNIDELYKHYYTIAEDLAKRFDGRNGTTEFITELNKLK